MTVAIQSVSGRMQEIGAINGFKLIASNPAERRCELTLQGGWEYELGRHSRGSQVLRAAIQELSRPSLEKHLTLAKARAEGLNNQMRELAGVIGKPFDKQARLDELRKQQIEIDTALDLSKGDLSAVDESVQAEDLVAA